MLFKNAGQKFGEKQYLFSNTYIDNCFSMCHGVEQLNMGKKYGYKDLRRIFLKTTENYYLTDIIARGVLVGGRLHVV